MQVADKRGLLGALDGPDLLREELCRLAVAKLGRLAIHPRGVHIQRFGGQTLFGVHPNLFVPTVDQDTSVAQHLGARLPDHHNRCPGGFGGLHLDAPTVNHVQLFGDIRVLHHQSLGQLCAEAT